jgi:capsular polysaccharide transport system permease protein
MTVDVRNPQGRALTPAERSKVISESLRQMARVSRFANRRKGARGVYGAARKSDVVTPILFAVLFVLPVVAGALYYGLIASDRYVTEARFAIRPAVGGAERAANDNIGTSDNVSKQLIAQDTLIIEDYLASRPLVEALERRMPLRAMFAREDIDWFSRFDAAKPIEKLVKYWRNRIDLQLATKSGIVTVTINAFDPQESYDIAKAVLAEGEHLVNTLTTQMRNDALAETEREMARAQGELTRIRAALRDLRNRDGVLDAQKVAEANLKMVSEIRAQRIQLAVRQQILSRDLNGNSRSIQDLQAQIAQLDDNIARIERASTNADPEQRRILSETLSRFETLLDEQKNAESYYAKVIAAHERARIIADRQIEFFSMVVEPVLAQSSEAPRRWLMFGIVTAGAAAAFAAALFGRKFLT